MKTPKLIAASAFVLICNAWTGQADLFDSGSTGVDGPLDVTNTLVLTLPPNGIFNFTTINISPSGTLKFTRNALNTPVYLLATSNVTIAGTIDVSGNYGTPFLAGQGGPGGFDGGNPPAAEGEWPGDGYGPGGGRAIRTNNNCFGLQTSGAFGTISTYSSTNRYGNLFLQPLVGGSGGAGMISMPCSGTVGGGGGGGGAILIAANTSITIASSGFVFARGGSGSPAYNSGSGGGVRLVAPTLSGSGYIYADGISYGGSGRIRLDALDRTQMNFQLSGRSSVGNVMNVFPSPIPRLDIVEVAGQAIPFGTNATVTVTLPVNSPTNQTVKVKGTDFAGQVSLEVVITPESGPTQRFPGNLNMGGTNQATATVNVIIPPDIPCRVNAWTR